MFAQRGHTLRILLALAIALAVTLLVACGGGDEETTPTPGPTEEETPEEIGAAEEDSVTVDEAFWHAGWKVTLGEATLRPATPVSRSDYRRRVREPRRRPRPTSIPNFFSPRRKRFPATELRRHDLPQVPGLRSGEGRLTSRSTDEFTLDDATLIIGNPVNNQAIVPIGPTRRPGLA